MRCPACGARDVYVIDSREHGDGIRRRRKCARCDHRWNTLEVPEQVLLELVHVVDRLRRPEP